MLYHGFLPYYEFVYPKTDVFQSLEILLTESILGILLHCQSVVGFLYLTTMQEVKLYMSINVTS